MARWPEPLSRAYAACESLAQSHYENFPVASRLLPAPMRPHVAAVYAFARVADDLADEGTVAPVVRRTQLMAWQRRLHEAVTVGRADANETRTPAGRDDLLLLALGHSIRTLDLPVSLFDDLVSAFGQDIMTTRYDSWCDVLDYCRRSANPVGRLVLRIAGHDDAALDQSSDALCTALQLTNFWQDFGHDWRIGRLYVPRQVQHACGATEVELLTGRLAPAWGRAIEACAAFTRDRFESGRFVCDGVHGRLRVELRFTWLGGMRMLERTERGRFELLDRRPVLGVADATLLVWQALRW